jgi:hypothetical protein
MHEPKAARASIRETIMTRHKPVLWTPDDWNAFFGFGTNTLVSLLVLTGLIGFVLKMPDDLVRILPATGLMLFLSTMYRSGALNDRGLPLPALLSL